MSQQIDKSTLGYLGVDFQYKLVKCFIEEPKFYGEISSIVTQNSFSDPQLRTIVGAIRDYYNKIGVAPNYTILLIELKSKSNTEMEIAEWEGIINKLRVETTVEGYSTIKELALKFFKQQNLVTVANKILDIAKKGDLDRYDECQRLVNDASIIGEEDDLGYSPYDKMEEALSDTYTIHVPTGIKLLDEALNGGLAKGKVGVIIGSAGFGKTTISTAMCSAASTYKCELNNNEGFKVLQIYFEDNDIDMTRKVYSRISQVESKDLTRTREQADEIREVLNNYPFKEEMKKNYRLKAFPAHKKTANDIRIFLKRLINSGFKPDMAVIDYFECLAPEKGGFSTDTPWIRESNTMRELENIAKEFDIALWVPTQGNKDSIISQDIVTMDKAGGSIVKVQAASVIVSIARSVQQQQDNIATLALIKNRGGSLGIWKNIVFNNGTSTISCDNVITYNNALAYEEDEAKAVEEYQRQITTEIAKKQRTIAYQAKIEDNEMPL